MNTPEINEKLLTKTGASKVSLKYDEKNNVFYFTTEDFNAMKIYGIARTFREGGYLYYFKAIYPDGWYAIRDFKALFPESTITKSAKAKFLYLKSVPEQIADLTEITNRKSKFKKYQPYIHQARCIEAMLHYPRLSILAEQGLGKTYISLNFMAIKKKELGSFKGLVFAPRIVLRNWMEESKELTNLKAIVYKGDDLQRRKIGEEILAGRPWDLIIVNYECVSNTEVKLREHENIRKGEISVGDEVQISKGGDWYKVARINGVKNKREFVLGDRLVSSPLIVKARRKIDNGRLVNRDFEFFANTLKFDVLFMDEGSRVKGHKSSRSLAVKEIAEKIEHRYILSGTITLGNPLDVYMPYTILNPLIFGTNFWKFKNKHCAFSKYNKHIITGYLNLEALKANMDPYTISFTRDNCLDLPDRTLIDRYYELSNEQVSLYNEIVSEDSIWIGDTEIDVSMAVVKISKLMQLVSGFMILPPDRDDSVCNNCPQLCDCVPEYIYPWNKSCSNYGTELVAHIKKPAREYFTCKRNPKLELFMEDMEDIEGQVIVWTYHQKELIDIRNSLDKAKIKYILAGKEGCDLEFRNDPTIKVFLGQISQGIGITLNTAKHTIYYSQSLSLEDRLQSMDRNYRIGQTSKVVVADYQSPGTLESTVIELLRSKRDVRDFIQSRVECTQCEQRDYCEECDIRPFSEDCLLYEVRQNAEKKTTIKLKTIEQELKNSY